MGDYALRPATPADREFSYRLHHLALGEYVEAIWGWDEEVQQDFHRRTFDPARTKIVTIEDREIGLVVVHDRPDELYLGLIEIHPDVQGQGIGASLIRRLQREAARRDQPLVLEVLNVNERAFALYRRLGFRETGRGGPNGIKIRMRWDPPGDAAPAPE
jgi:ribosomal protein S18 acetylase RimI-like enzyme